MDLDAERGDLVSEPELLRGERADLDRVAAERVASEIEQRLREASHVVLGVVGGRSVGGIYGHLQRASLPWDRLHVFLADERLVPVTSEESNFKLVRDDLLATPLASGALPEGNAHAFPFDPDAPDGGCSAYDRALSALGGVFDVAILSAGEDGHTASLFPDHPSVRAAGDGYLLVENSPKPPPRRISASRGLLERTRLGLLVFYGEEKREALQRFRAPELTTLQCPCRVVRSMDRSVVLTDLA